MALNQLVVDGNFMKDYSVSEETLGYQTSTDPSNTDRRLLIGGSKNTLIDYQKKVKTRSGYTRFGIANTSLTPVRGAWTWDTSTGFQAPIRFYDDELEVYLGTVDTYEINAWTRVRNGWSTTAKMRADAWFDATENIDLFLMVVGDANIYEWNGAVAVASSISTAIITEAGDASNQLSAWAFTGASSSNTNAFVLYYKLTDVAGTRTVEIYKDSAGSNLVASGTLVGDGTVTLTAQNSSGLSGSVVVAYTVDDTTVSANTLTLTYSITKLGTTTFAQNRFYSTRNKTLINVRTGSLYTYTGGESTTTLTGITPNTVVDITANDILVQQYVSQSNKPSANHNNHTIYVFENQVVIGSNDDEEIYISANDSYSDFAFSSPRAAGEGALLTLSDPTRAISSIGSNLLIFSGQSTIFKVLFEQIAIGSTLAETAKVKKLDIGVNQGALCHEAVLPIGNSIAYLSNEVALRIISNPDDLEGLNPKTYSNPIKPDFDAEDWFDGTTPDAYMAWWKNIIFISAPQASHVYMLNFVEDADGKLKRYWNPPQVLPVGAMTIIDLDDGKGGQLYGHSNVVPESYLLFDGASDGQYSDMDSTEKLPIEAIATFAYNSFGKQALLKNFDEYYVKGEITTNTTDLILTLKYDYEGSTQTLDKTIDGSDESILEGNVQFNSLAQQSLAVNPLGGFLNPPSDARRFSKVFEYAKEDFFEISPTFSTNETDRYWAVITHGPNIELSKRKPVNKKG